MTPHRRYLHSTPSALALHMAMPEFTREDADRVLWLFGHRFVRRP